EMRPAGVAEEVEHAGGAVGHDLALGPLAVEDPERVLGHASLVLVAQRVGPLLEIGAQRTQVPRTALGVAERIEQEPDLAQTERSDDALRQGNDLDVEIGVLGTEGLGADLVMLPVAARLGALVAELRRDVPRLERCRRTV